MLKILRHLTLFILLYSLSPGLTAQQTTIGTEAPSSPKKIIIKYGVASFYAEKFNGRQTATGEIYSSAKLSAACNVLPLGTWIKVTNIKNSKSVVVRVNDRLHPKNPRLIDLSRMAARQLGYTGAGLTRVKVEVLGKLPKREIEKQEETDEVDR